MFFEVFIPILFGLVGLMLGSFSNVIIYRGANDIPLLSKTRSFCPNCQHELRWYDNIPLLSFILLKGRCRYCKQPISKRYPLVELTGMLIFLVPYFLYAYLYDGSIGYHYIEEPMAIIDSVVTSFVLLFLFDAAFIDKKTQTVPTYLLILIVLPLIARGIASWVISPSHWALQVISLGLSVLLFLGSFLLTKLIYKQEAIGLADVIIAVGLGFAYDVFSFIFFLIVTCVLAAIIEIIKLRKQNKGPFAFVPYIFLGVLFMALAFPLARDWFIGGLGL